MTNHMTARPMQSPLLTQWGYQMFLLACCFSGCCVEIFSYLDTCLCKALWEFVSELKVLDVCIYEALMNQNWPQPGWSKHLFFVRHLHRWPVERTVWNEDVIAPCSNKKMFHLGILPLPSWSLAFCDRVNRLTHSAGARWSLFSGEWGRSESVHYICSNHLFSVGLCTTVLNVTLILTRL